MAIGADGFEWTFAKAATEDKLIGGASLEWIRNFSNDDKRR